MGKIPHVGSLLSHAMLELLILEKLFLVFISKLSVRVHSCLILYRRPKKEIFSGSRLATPVALRK